MSETGIKVRKRCIDDTVPSRFLGVADNNFAYSQHHVPMPSYIYRFWHGVIPTSNFILLTFTFVQSVVIQLGSFRVMYVHVSSLNGSVITFSCDPGYSLHGSTTSQCVLGEWNPIPESVIRESVDSLCRDGADTPMPPPF